MNQRRSSARYLLDVHGSTMDTRLAYAWPWNRFCSALFILFLLCLIPACKRDQPSSADDSPKAKSTSSGDYLSAMHEGHACAAKWDQVGAVAAFRRALEIDPQSVPARVNLGLAQLLDNKFDTAVDTLKGLANQPSVSMQVEYLYGLSLLKAGRAEEAVEPLRRASEQAPHESSLLFQYGVALQEAKKTDNAATVYRKVIEMDRFHITAPFRLARIERLAGNTDEADRWMLKSEQNRAILGAEASEREVKGLNRFTKPMDPPLTWEPRRNARAIRFRDVTESWSSSANPPIGALAVIPESGLLLGPSRDGWRIWEYKDRQLKLTSHEVAAEPPANIPPLRALVADCDNDGDSDVLFFSADRVRLLRQGDGGRFRDETEQAGLADVTGPLIWMDDDHDGDLDLVSTSSTLRLFRNRGDCAFTDDSASMRLPAGVAISTNLAFGDLNDDDATDLIFQRDDGMTLAFNAGLSNYDAPHLPPIRRSGAMVGLAVNDVDNDGRLEVVTTVLEDADAGHGRIIFIGSTLADLPFTGLHISDLSLLDYDADGFLDLLVVGTQGLRLWRNMGSGGWRDVTAEVGLDAFTQNPTRSDVPWTLSIVDLDRDGDPDLLIRVWSGQLHFIRNEADATARSLRLTLEGTKTNRSGIGARIDIRAGKARIFRNITSQPITIGAGEFEKLDLVKIIWTTGATDAFTNVPVDKPLHVVETTVTLGSCPHLYVWDGDRFRFVTDILGNAPLGLPCAPGKYLPADTSEIVWLGNEASVAIVESDQSTGRERGDSARNVGARQFSSIAGAAETGLYRHSTVANRPSRRPFARAPGSDGRRMVVEITDELRELLYLDEVRLLVVDHPHDVEVHPNDKVMPPPFPPSEVWAVRNARPPVSAIDDAGHVVADRLARMDGIKVWPRALRPPPLKGLAETTSFILDFGSIDTAKANVMVMNGWLHWGGASSNIAAAQNPAIGNPFPALEAKTEGGAWQMVDVVVGAPSGKTKSILVDLTDKLPEGTKQLRLTWGLELYWDRIALAERMEKPSVTEFAPASAELYYRGVPRMTRAAPDQPFIPNYDDLLDAPPWRNIPEGFCTRYGDVLELLTATDDRYVIMNCGDACRIEFDVTDIPPVAEGWSRDYFLYTDGWDKDMDHNVRTGNTVLPLPVHGQDEQRYGLEQVELPSTDWIDEYNTRRVAGQWGE